MLTIRPVHAGVFLTPNAKMLFRMYGAGQDVESGDRSTGVVLHLWWALPEEEDRLAHGRHARKKQHLNGKNLPKLCAAAVTATLMGGTVIPAAHADVLNDGTSAEPSDHVGYVASMRSFPKANTARVDLFSEAVSVDVDGEWSLGENEDADTIGKNLKKQADDYDRRKAEEAKAKAEEARKEAEATKAKEEAEAQARQQAAAAPRQGETGVDRDSTGSQAASRSYGREALEPSVGSQASSSKGKEIVSGALSLVGGSMDCTMLATLALQKGTGVYFHGWPEDYRNFPGAVETSWGDAQSGDILVYRDGTSYDMNGPGHADHVAIYIGNGMAVHGGWNGGIVAVAQAVTSQGIPEHVYRVM